MKINLYGIGGAGSNVVSHFTKYAGEKLVGYAELETYFVDTSRSNLSDKIPSEKVYLVDGLDGSGKKRDSNYTVLAERAKEILQQFKPTDINIIVHSASGGKQTH